MICLELEDIKKQLKYVNPQKVVARGPVASHPLKVSLGDVIEPDCQIEFNCDRINF